MSAADAMRRLWAKFGPSMTRSSIHVGGTTRQMTDKEMQLFDEAFGAFDDTFAKMGNVFDEARAENKRRKEG